MLLRLTERMCEKLLHKTEHMVATQEMLALLMLVWG